MEELLNMSHITDDNMETLMDHRSDKLSDCCGAPILMYSICSDCKEHCSEEKL